MLRSSSSQIQRSLCSHCVESLGGWVDFQKIARSSVRSTMVTSRHANFAIHATMRTSDLGCSVFDPSVRLSIQPRYL